MFALFQLIYANTFLMAWVWMPLHLMGVFPPTKIDWVLIAGAVVGLVLTAFDVVRRL